MNYRVLRTTRETTGCKNQTTAICHKGAGKIQAGYVAALPSLWSLTGNGSPTSLPKTVNTGQGKKTTIQLVDILGSF